MRTGITVTCPKRFTVFPAPNSHEGPANIALRTMPNLTKKDIRPLNDPFPICFIKQDWPGKVFVATLTNDGNLSFAIPITYNTVCPEKRDLGVFVYPCPYTT